MGTRSLIGKRLDDGKIRHVYSHWDGYPSCNGVILRDHYADPDKIDALLDEGDISSLGSEIGDAHDFDDFENRPENATTFYRRDRGEKDVDARTTSNELFILAGNGVDFLYLFVDGAWQVLCTYNDDGFIPLDQAIMNDTLAAKLA